MPRARIAPAVAGLALAGFGVFAVFVGWLLWKPSDATNAGRTAQRGGAADERDPGAIGAIGTGGADAGDSADRGAVPSPASLGAAALSGAASPEAGARAELLPGAPAAGGGTAGETPDAPGWIGVRLAAADGGQPIAGARVEARSAEHRVEGVTDGEGRLRLGWSARQPADLAVVHAAFVDVERPGVRPGEELELLLERSGAIDGQLELAPGVVLAAGDAVLAARDGAGGGSKSGAPPVAAPADADGRFVFEDLTPGNYTLVARVADGAGTALSGLCVEHGRRTRAQLDVEQPGTLAGTLRVAPDGRPLGEAALTLTSRRAGLAGSLEDATSIAAATDDQGAFEARGLAPGPYLLQVELPWSGRYAANVDLPESGARVVRDFSVPGPGRAAGVVMDAGGASIGAADVLALREKDDELLAALIAGANSTSTAGALAATVSAGDGSFEFSALPAAEKLVLVASTRGERGLAPGWTALAPLAAGEARAGIQVRLAGAASIRGRVRGPQGEALAGAELEAQSRLGKRFAPGGPRTTSDAEGRFEIGGLPPVAALVEARAPGCLAQQIEVDLALVPAAELDFDLERAARLEVAAVDERGWAVTGLKLRLRSALDGPGAAPGSFPEPEIARTDALGRARFDGLRPGEWRVELAGAGSASSEWELVELEPRVVDLPTDQPVRAVVHRAASAARASVVGVVALQSGGAPEGVVVSGAGGALVTIDGVRFSVSGLPPGEIALTLRAKDAAWKTLGPWTLGPGEQRDAGVIALAPARSLAVRAEHAGAAVEKAKLRLTPLAPEQGGPVPEPPGASLRFEHRGNGRQVLDVVPYGRYRLKVGAPGMKPYSRQIEVSASSPAELAVELLAEAG